MRCIDADSLEELFREVIGGIAKKPEMNGNLEHMIRASAMVIEMIQDAPTIEPERKTGRWIHDGYAFKGGIDWMHCSECGHKDCWSAATRTPFCAWCGAKMEDTNESD